MKLRGGTSAERRQHALRYWIEPMAAAIFRFDRSVASVTTALAQYWNDEARDAVHVRFRASSLPDPGWPVRGEVELPYDRLAAEVSGVEYAFEQGPSENLELVLAFASLCPRSAHQEMDEAQAYAPWAITRPAGEGVVSELFNTVRQPLWEDRFWLADWQHEVRAATPLQRRASRGEPIPMDTLLRAMDVGEKLPELLRVSEALLRALKAREAGARVPDAVVEAVEERLAELSRV